MEKILIAVANKTNSNLIADLLKNQYCVVYYKNDMEIVLQYDLLILDGRMLAQFREKHILLKNDQSSLFQPILLITSKKDTGLISQVWQTVDEIITTPILKLELLTRVEMLLRTQRQSSQLEHYNSLLLQENKRLQTESKMVIDFFTNMSHELKTPLTVIFAGIDVIALYLREEMEDYSNSRNTIRTLKQNALRLLRIINNLLDLSKIDSGYMELHLANINIKDSLSEIIDSIQGYTKSKQLKLSFISETSFENIAVDKNKIECIILNLLSNAIKNSQPDGTLTVMLKDNPSNDRIIISVQDNGLGIPQDKQKLIFDRFRQVDNSFSKQSEGCGIGLSLAKALVELHEGRIWVESKPGIGSKFSFELPVKSIAFAPSLRIVSNIKNKIDLEFSAL